LEDKEEEATTAPPKQMSELEKKQAMEQSDRKKLLERNEAVGGLKAKLGIIPDTISSHLLLLTPANRLVSSHYSEVTRGL